MNAGWICQLPSKEASTQMLSACLGGLCLVGTPDNKKATFTHQNDPFMENGESTFIVTMMMMVAEVCIGGILFHAIRGRSWIVATKVYLACQYSICIVDLVPSPPFVVTCCRGCRLYHVLVARVDTMS